MWLQGSVKAMPSFVHSHFRAHPPLRAARAGSQDRAAGASGAVARDARGQPAGARGCASLHAPRGGHRPRVLPALQARPLVRGRASRRRPRGHCSACSAPAGRLSRPAVTRTRAPLCVQRRLAYAGPGPRAPATPRRHAGPRLVAVASTTRRLRCQRATSAKRRSPLQRASALPAPAAETYTAHSTVGPAVQSNEVYPTPCTTVPSISIASASDKRYSLGLAL